MRRVKAEGAFFLRGARRVLLLSLLLGGFCIGREGGGRATGVYTNLNKTVMTRGFCPPPRTQTQQQRTAVVASPTNDPRMNRRTGMRVAGLSPKRKMRTPPLEGATSFSWMTTAKEAVSSPKKTTPPLAEKAISSPVTTTAAAA